MSLFKHYSIFSFRRLFRKKPTEGLLNPVTLGELIESNLSKIISAFADQVRIDVPGARGETRTYVIDHLDGVLIELMKYLKTSGETQDYIRSARLANEHGLQRARGEKYSLGDLRLEYAILRKIILSYVPKNCGLSVEASALFSEIFELSLAHAVENFVRNSASELLEHKAEQQVSAEHLSLANNERDSANNQQLWFIEAINCIPKPLFLLDFSTKKISFSNKAAKKMLGADYQDVFPLEAVKSLVSVTYTDGRIVDPADLPSQRTLRGETLAGDEIRLNTKVGSFHLKVFSEQLPEAYGQPRSALILFQDITELKQTEDRLLRAQKDLNAAVQIAQVGFWQLDAKTSNINVSAILLKQFGINPLTFKNTLKEAADVMHPEDRGLVEVAISRALEFKEPYHIEYRVVHPSGEIHWIEAKGTVDCDQAGKPFQLTGTTLDITEKVRARAAAEKASAAKSQFLANMSHEIRTPLGAIMGFASLLKDDSIDRTQHLDFVSVIERNSSQLLRIIDDILDLSKVEAGMVVIEHIDFSLPEMLADFSSLMSLKAREKAIGFTSRAATPLPQTVNTDPTRLRQILMNIVGNAIKFTDAGHVELRVSYGDNSLVFEVEDTGRGISSEQEKNLFQPFSQADSSTTRKYGGTGLGLVLTRSLSEALGGEFNLLRSELGSGSVFAAKIKVQINENVLFASDLGFGTTPPKAAANLGKLSGLSILLVEDSPDNQALISIYLARAGTKADIASDGAQGFQMALTGRYDVVLMDVQMPVMDGITSVKKMRAENYRGPVVALTAHAMKEERIRCIEAGFDDFLSKPITREDLVNLLLRYKP